MRVLDLRILIALIGLLWAGPAAADRPGKNCREAENAISTRALFDKFSGPIAESCDFTIVQLNWGGHTAMGDYSGGVIKANVGKRDGRLVLTARGNRYDGAVRGYDKDGTVRPDGRRTGAAVMSRQRYLGGRFEARVTVPPVLGVASALWTFVYEELPDGGPIENHEIDIELPGRASDAAAPSFRYVLLSTWRGLEKGHRTTAFQSLPETVTDGKFHVLRFDWQPPSEKDEGFVALYIDRRLLKTIRSSVPSKAGNLWLGLWFPRKWAGVADFGIAEMKIDWVRITPLKK